MLGEHNASTQMSLLVCQEVYLDLTYNSQALLGLLANGKNLFYLFIPELLPHLCRAKYITASC